MTAIVAEAVQRKFPWGFAIFLLIWLVPAIICFTVPDWWFFAFWMFPVSIPWLLAPVLALILSLVRFYRGRYQAAGRLLSIPILFIALFWYSRAGWADRVWFELHRRIYENAISEITKEGCAAADWTHSGVVIGELDCGPPMTVVFEFGSFLDMWHGLVYNQTDDIAKLQGGRSLAQGHGRASEWLACSTVSQNLGNHYYLMSGSIGRCN